jgi:hypothetical protein
VRSEGKRKGDESCTCISATDATSTGSGRDPSDPFALLLDPADLHRICAWALTRREGALRRRKVRVVVRSK